MDQEIPRVELIGLCERSREQNGQNMPEPTYRADQMKSLEASAETLQDTLLLW